MSDAIQGKYKLARADAIPDNLVNIKHDIRRGFHGPNQISDILDQVHALAVRYRNLITILENQEKADDEAKKES